MTTPVIIESSKVRPEYPELARLARLEGAVVLRVVVHADGTVGDVRLEHCNRPGVGFEKAAIAAVRLWRFEAATRDGQPVDAYLEIEETFELEND